MADPIFVVGSSRSGTTLMRQMLSAHPRIHLTMEASFYLWEAFWPGWWRGYHGFPPFYMSSYAFRWLKLDPRPILEALPRPFRRPHLKRLYTEVMRRQAETHGKPRFGDKTPSHAASLKRIFEDYPGARVVRMVRDPRDVVRSLLGMPWAPGSLVAAITMTWSESRQAAPFRHQILEVSLSDLRTDPRGTLERVLDWVDEPFEASVLEPERYGPQDLPPVPWFRAAGRGLATSPPPPPVPLSDYDRRIIEVALAGSLREQGLHRMPLDPEPGFFRLLAHFATHLPRAAQAGYIGLQLARAVRQGTSDSVVAERLLREFNPEAWARLGAFRLPAAPELPHGWEQHWS